MASERGGRGLDLLSFFIADVQTGFGPFIAVFLIGQLWTQTDIGLALSIGAVATLFGQIPGGLLIDALRRKRRAARWAIIGIASAAILLVTLPDRLPVFLALVMQGLASCVLGPAIAAISLALVGHTMLSERLARNARFASIGNGLAAGIMGALGTWVSDRAVFWLTAALAIPALYALRMIGPLEPVISPKDHPLPTPGEIWQLLTDRRLVIFGICCALFHLSNAAMVPLIAADVTRDAGRFAELLVASAIVVPQAVVALLSLWVGRTAEQRGRRPVLLLGWAMLPVRGVLLAVLPSPWLLPVVQALSGISGAVFGIMLPLIAADLSRGTPRLNLCMALLSFAMGIGAAVSTTFAGAIADWQGQAAALTALALAGLAGTLLVWLGMPETKDAEPACEPADMVDSRSLA